MGKFASAHAFTAPVDITRGTIMPDDQANADEGASPEKDLRAQNLGETTTADQVNADDPHKAEKLAKAGRKTDPNDGAE